MSNNIFLNATESVTVNTGVILKAPYMFKIHLTNVFLLRVCLQSVNVLPETKVQQSIGFSQEDET